MSRTFRVVPPSVMPMLESLRGLGYTTATALADLIDNCISAEASRVDINFSWALEKSTIEVIDNGSGMTDDRLVKAMTIGGMNPRETRSERDLGRFGFGLKTASLSQCRAVTVASKVIGGECCCLRWDLDQMLNDQCDEWRIYDGPRDGSEWLLEKAHSLKSGTVVLWENADRIVTPRMSQKDFLTMIDRVEMHLAMVFSSYLSQPRQLFSIYINDRKVKPWDPFMENNPATWRSPLEKIQTAAGEITFQGYVLPHRDHLSEAEYEHGAGIDGWTGQQGLYVFRGDRLLVAASWLGLGDPKPWTKDESSKLARVRVCIPNSADQDWKIDIKKSVARVPTELKDRLSILAADVRMRARQVFAFRGHVNRGHQTEDIVPAWNSIQSRDGTRYRINRSHPSVSAVLEASGPEKSLIESVLILIEQTVPVQRIWLDSAEAKDSPMESGESSITPEISAMIRSFLRQLVHQKGLTETEARQKLANTEPFNRYRSAVESAPIE